MREAGVIFLGIVASFLSIFLSVHALLDLFRARSGDCVGVEGAERAVREKGRSMRWGAMGEKHVHSSVEETNGSSCSSSTDSMLLPRLEDSMAANCAIFCKLSCSMSMFQKDLAACLATLEPKRIPMVGDGSREADLIAFGWSPSGNSPGGLIG